MEIRFDISGLEKKMNDFKGTKLKRSSSKARTESEAIQSLLASKIQSTLDLV